VVHYSMHPIGGQLSWRSDSTSRGRQLRRIFRHRAGHDRRATSSANCKRCREHSVTASWPANCRLSTRARPFGLS